jgi:hypothetical protein
MLAIALALAGATAGAAPPPVRLWMEASFQAQRLTLVPHLEAPAGTSLRYEMVTVKSGPAGRSTTRQGGGVTVGEEGSSPLSTVSIGMDAQDRCDVAVRVLEGTTVVAEREFRYPE